jgi:two-component system secretion system response regulator SalR
MKHTIIIIEDSKVFAKGLQMLLIQKENINQVFTALNYSEAIQYLEHENISIAIVDLHFRTSHYDGFTIAEKLASNYPNVKIMILSDYVQTDYYDRLFKNKSVKAYLDKQSDDIDIFEGIDTVLKDNIYLSPSIEKLKELDKWMVLTRREKEVLEQLVKGLTQSKIADLFFISEKTVGRHVMNLLQKFNVHNTPELVAKYVKYRNSNDENVDERSPPFQRI